nr:TraD N-terminal domain-containing protein [Klebsiella pneumoniae]
MRDIIRSQPVYTIQYYGQSLEYTSEQNKYTICGSSPVFSRVSCYLYGRSSSPAGGRQQQSDKPKEVARQMKRDGMASDIKIGDLPILKTRNPELLPPRYRRLR